MSIEAAVIIWLFVVWVCWNIHSLHRRVEWLESKLSQARGEQWWVK